MKMLICEQCNHECGTKEIDIGIGGYEYWGFKGVDSRKVEVSDCCEADYHESESEDDDE